MFFEFCFGMNLAKINDLLVLAVVQICLKALLKVFHLICPNNYWNILTVTFDYCKSIPTAATW